jgi:hypothetical protein
LKPYPAEEAQRRNQGAARVAEQKAANRREAMRGAGEAAVKTTQAAATTARRTMQQLSRWGLATVHAPVVMDRRMRDSLGEENALMYRFAQIMLYLVLPFLAILVYLEMAT